MPLEDVDANVVRARLFELVDDEGRVRARMAPRNDADSVGLEFYERDGTIRLAIGINLEGTSVIDLKDEAGSTRARLGVESAGVPTVLSLRNAANRLVAQIALHDEESTGLSLGDEWGNTLIQAAVFGEGDASIHVNDTEVR
jgi:hypothetical protein